MFFPNQDSRVTFIDAHPPSISYPEGMLPSADDKLGAIRGYYTLMVEYVDPSDPTSTTQKVLKLGKPLKNVQLGRKQLAEYVLSDEKSVSNRVWLEEAGGFLNPLLWKANLFYGNEQRSIEENFRHMKALVQIQLPHASIMTQIMKKRALAEAQAEQEQRYIPDPIGCSQYQQFSGESSHPYISFPIQFPPSVPAPAHSTGSSTITIPTKINKSTGRVVKQAERQAMPALPPPPRASKPAATGRGHPGKKTGGHPQTSASMAGTVAAKSKPIQKKGKGK